MTASSLAVRFMSLFAIGLAGCSVEPLVRGGDGSVPEVDGSVPAVDGARVAPDSGPGPSCHAPTEACEVPADCCTGSTCGTTTLGLVCCGNEGAPCATADGSDCCGDLLCIDGTCGRESCRAVLEACSSTGECCDGRTCGTTTAGQVCCGLEGASCTTADGADCCGDLLCTGGRCVSPSCSGPTEPCTSSSECCSGRTCGTTTLGQVCCGNDGASCSTPDGSDCCGDLLCIGGRCGHDSGSCGPTLAYYPVRAAHNNGYDPTAGDSSMWSCDDGHSNSDFVGGSHLGNDIWAVEGAPVVATVSGTLRYVAFSSYSGNKLTIVDDCGWYHFYCHLQGFGPGIAPGASDGAHVTAGQVVGYVGRTGTASHGVVHLHYSIYPADTYDAGIDPYPYLHAVERAVCSVP